MPGERDQTSKKDLPRTDLPPDREPYYEGYFGTDEEEGVVREEDDAHVDEGSADEDRDPTGRPKHR